MSLAFLVLAWTDARADFGNLPLAFEGNRGQIDPRVRFLARGSGFQLFLTEDEAVYRVRDEVLRMRLVGGVGASRIRGVDPLPSVSHYLDRAPAIAGVPHFGRVELSEVYRGIDLAYYGTGAQLEYDFIVAPGADPRSINVEVDGAQSLAIDHQGQLRIRTRAGDVIWRAPVARQDSRPVQASYVLRGKNRFGFRVGRYDRSRILVIDPILAYSTLIGGAQLETPRAIAVDETEQAVIVGESTSTDFPTTAGAYKTMGTGIFVAKLNAAGNALVYATFLGTGTANGVALHDGHAYVTGSTSSAFPLTSGAVNNSITPGGNVFVTKLTTDGSGLVYSALLAPGSGSAIAVDGTGAAYVTGNTAIDTFPTTPTAFQPTRPTLGDTTYTGDLDAFFIKLNATGSAILYSTYLGSTNLDLGSGIAVDSSGHAYVAGTTQGRSAPWNSEPMATLPFPTTAGAYRQTFVASANAFVAKFDPSASGAASLLYSTLLGADNEGSGAEAVAVDGGQHAYVTGLGGISFPLTPGAYGAGSTVGGAFVAKLDAAGSQLVYSAMIAGSGRSRIALDSANNAFVSGRLSNSSAFTTVNPLPGGTGGNYFVAKLDPSGSAVGFATRLDGHDATPAIAVDPFGSAYVCGQIFPAAFNTEAFVAKIANRPPIVRVGPDLELSAPATFTLSAAPSSDPDGDALTYLWKDDTGAVMATAADVMLQRPQGIYTFTVTVSDGFYSVSDSVVVSVYVSAWIDLYGSGTGRVTSNDGRIDCPGMCQARYAEPLEITLTATPSTGSVFTTWGVFGLCSGSGDCVLTMDASRMIGAQFDLQPAVPTALSIAPSSATFGIGGTQRFAAMATFSDGTIRRVSADHSVEASDPDTCAITRNGLVECWGLHFPTPTAVPAFENAVELSAGTAHVCALLPDGTVNCCSFISGAVCDVPVPGINTAVAIASGSVETCALLADGTVSCFAVGVSPSASGITNAVAIGAEGGLPPCAVIADGTVQCVRDVGPETINGINNAVAVTAGPEHGCALLTDGTVSCWGRNQEGQLGNGTTDMVQVYPPAPVIGLSNAISVVAGDYHNCALLADRTIKCWGRAVPNGSNTMSATAIAVPNLTNVMAVSAGANHTCATFSNGTMQCWGYSAPVGGLVGFPTSHTPVTVPLDDVIALGWSAGGAEAQVMASGTAVGRVPGLTTITATLDALAATASVDVTNTAAGANVSVRPELTVSLTFANVTQAGTTTASVTDTGSTPPSGFQLGDPARYYELSTTAAYLPPVTVCINYAYIAFSGTPQLFHYENGAWQDVTTSVDTTTTTVCGSVSSLSPFSLFSPIDTVPPAITSVTASPSVLWPPNQKMVPVTVTTVATEASHCRIVDVTSNEPVTSADWRITGDSVVKLRADRLGKGNGRFYKVSVRCTDASNNSATGTVDVTVPHDQGQN